MHHRRVRIRINTQQGLQRRPDAGYKKFAEPVTVTYKVALVTMGAKDIDRMLVYAGLQQHAFIDGNIHAVDLL